MTSSVTLYGLTRCDTCVKARRWLDAQAVDYTFVDYRDHPVAPELLVAWAADVGGWEKLINRSSPSWRGLSAEDQQASTDADWLRLIAATPTLVRRPVLVTADGKAGVGFKEATYRERLGLAG